MMGLLVDLVVLWGLVSLLQLSYITEEPIFVRNHLFLKSQSNFLL